MAVLASCGKEQRWKTIRFEEFWLGRLIAQVREGFVVEILRPKTGLRMTPFARARWVAKARWSARVRWVARDRWVARGNWVARDKW